MNLGPRPNVWLAAVLSLVGASWVGASCTRVPVVVDDAPPPTAGGAAGAPARKMSAVMPSDSGYGWSEVSGPRVGDNKAPLSDLRKPIKVKVTNQTDYMSMRAWAVRWSRMNDTDVIVEVTNGSDQLRCFVQAEHIQFKASDGGMIEAVATTDYIYGSLAKTDLFVTGTCLGPGESGYFFADAGKAKDATVFDKIAEIDFALDFSEGKFERPPFRLVAKSYTVRQNRITATVANEGSDNAPLADLLSMRLLLLDGDGLPVYHTFMNLDEHGAQLGPGKTMTVSDSIYFDATSERIKIMPGY